MKATKEGRKDEREKKGNEGESPLDRNKEPLDLF